MIFSKPVPNTDPVAIDQFLSRGTEAVFPSKDAFAKVLSSGKRISMYFGIDPTGPTLHIGHIIPLMKLAELQKLGHQITLLIGDFTAMIGDPTDKLSARKQLTRAEVLKNLRLYKEQTSKFISFKGKNAAKIKYNSSWLSKMSFADVIGLASKMTVDQMLKRDMFRARMAEEKPVYIHEFMYPLMQGYDSIAMDVDAEIGGNDQTFNMLTGRDLMRSVRNKEKFVIATKLLVDPTGKKMGKTEGNMITLQDEPNDMFGKVMSWSDALIISGYELCTQVSVGEIEKEKAFLAGGGNPRDAKLRLAEALVTLYHGSVLAAKGREAFLGAFSKGAMPDDAPEVIVVRDAVLVDVLLAEKTVSSKTDFRRLVSEGAIKDLKGEGAVKAFDLKVTADMDLKIGKHRFLKIRVK
jgi:tyrosyl-tRNA synthetase